MDAYDSWLNDVVMMHGVHRYQRAYEPKATEHNGPVKSIYYLCDHYGEPEKTKKITPEVKRRRTTKSSIKVGCLSRFSKHVYGNDSVKVVYNWMHNNHDPCDIEDMSHSRLPLELRKWISDCVDRHMNIQSIKSILRLNLKQLDDVSNIGNPQRTVSVGIFDHLCFLRWIELSMVVTFPLL
jgi:hypothetical protein